jgi:hypothetical protein
MNRTNQNNKNSNNDEHEGVWGPAGMLVTVLGVLCMAACGEGPAPITMTLQPVTPGLTAGAQSIFVSVWTPGDLEPVYSDRVSVSATEQPDVDIGTFNTTTSVRFFVFVCAVAAANCEASNALWHGCALSNYNPNAPGNAVNIVVYPKEELLAVPVECSQQLAQLGNE